jgi:hypothetical protein
MPRTWTGDEDIRAITRETRLEVLKHNIFSDKLVLHHLQRAVLNYNVYPPEDNLDNMLYCRL